MIRRRTLVLALVTALAFGAPAHAQDVTSIPPPILTLNQERLYSNSAFGQRVRRELEEASVNLVAENRRIEAALVAEEKQLTEDRTGMEPEAFRKLAEDFDVRVTGIRRAQVEKRNSLQREADTERARFFDLAYPVLFQLVEETGALAILNQSAVILSSRQIDVTELAVERVDASIGEAAPVPDPPTAPQQRPEEGQQNEPVTDDAPTDN